MTFVAPLRPFERRLSGELAEKGRLKAKGPTVTVSGLSGSGKSTIARSVARGLGLRYVTAGQLFRRYARERGVPLEVFSRIRGRAIDLEMDRRTLELAMRGGCVIDARLSGWIAGKWADCRIFVHAPLEWRAGRVASREGLRAGEAMRTVRERDLQDTRKYRTLYSIDQRSRSGRIYDIVLDNSALSLRGARSVPLKEVRSFLGRHHRIR